MEKINELIIYLLAIKNFAKDIHYHCKGEAFYSKHLLADRVEENIDGYIDAIKEIFFLAAEKEPLSSSSYLRGAANIIPEIKNDDKTNFNALNNLIVLALQSIEEIQDLTKGEENLIGAIAENLQNSMGLLNRQIK